MHALCHLVSDIQEGGMLCHYRANAFEASHKLVKRAYNAGSRRGDDGHSEALRYIARDDLLRLDDREKTSLGSRLSVVSVLCRVGTKTTQTGDDDQDQTGCDGD